MPSKLQHPATSFDYSPLEGALSNFEILPSNLDWTVPTVENPSSIDRVYRSGRGLIIENKVGEPLRPGAATHLEWWADLNPNKLKVLVVWHSGKESPTVPGAFLFDPIFMQEIGQLYGEEVGINKFRHYMKIWLEP
jgi:hypothetical protein